MCVLCARSFLYTRTEQFCLKKLLLCYIKVPPRAGTTFSSLILWQPNLRCKCGVQSDKTARARAFVCSPNTCLYERSLLPWCRTFIVIYSVYIKAIVIIIPVSYTHLDVYKRQALLWLPRWTDVKLSHYKSFARFVGIIITIAFMYTCLLYTSRCV